MGVQAGAARRVLGRDPEQAAASLSVVEDSARTAVEELRRMLGTLRSHDASDGPGEDTDRGGARTAVGAAPSTEGIGRIAEVVEAARTAGHPPTGPSSARSVRYRRRSPPWRSGSRRRP